MNNKNRIIAFANLKGGVGKTTLCALFASFLHEEGIPVAVIDADIQQSLFRHRQRELKLDPEAKLPYQVLNLPSRKASDVTELMKKVKTAECYILIDCPGNFEAEALKPIFENITHAVIPLSYDDDSVDGTGLFISGFKQIAPQAKIIFAPNRVKTNAGKKVELEARKKTIEILGSIGRVVPRVKEGIAIQRYSTLYPIDYYQKSAVENSFKSIMEEIEK